MVYLIDITADIGGLQGVLNEVYNQMMASCSMLTSVSMGLAAFGAMLGIYKKAFDRVSYAKWPDIEILYRPCAIAIAIAYYPYLIALINGVMQPLVVGTQVIAGTSNQAVATLIQQKQDALKNSTDYQMYTGPTGSGSLDKWKQLSGEADSGFMSGLSNRMKFEMAKTSYDMRNSIKVWLSEILQILFESAALCINTIRTFYLVILAILGPLSLAYSTFPGLEDSLIHWFSRYLNVFLWLPVANIFGALIGQIQQEMIKLDISQLNTTGQTTFQPTDAAYLVFLVMAIAGYFTVPTITGYIVKGGGTGVHLWFTKFLKS